MAIAKITLNGTTLMNATDVTATAEDIIAPATAMIANGTKPVGTASGGTQIDWDGFVDGSWPIGDVEVSSAITSIANYALYNRSGITSLSASSVTSIGSNAMSGCHTLSSIELPECVSIGASAFYACYLLTNVSLPKCTTLAQSSFYGAGQDVPSGNRIWVFPALTAVPSDGFRQFGCDTLDLGPSCASLGTRAFYQPTYGGYVKALILRKSDAVVTATATNTLDKVNASTKVYVPSALINSYKEATNWSAKGDIFYPIEGSIYENAYADGTPIT